MPGPVDSYVLCLKKDPARYDRFRRSWYASRARSGYPVDIGPTRVYGMNSDRFERVPEWRGENGKDRRGHTACYWGHVQMWRQALAENDEFFNHGYALFFEDDAELDEDFWNRLRQGERELPENWDLLYVGGQHRINGRPAPDVYSENLFKVKNVNRLHGYALRLKAIPTILLWFEEHHEWSTNFHDAKTGGYEAEFDYALASLVENGTLNGFALRKWTCFQGGGYSWTQGKEEPARRFELR